MSIARSRLFSPHAHFALSRDDNFRVRNGSVDATKPAGGKCFVARVVAATQKVSGLYRGDNLFDLRLRTGKIRDHSVLPSRRPRAFVAQFAKDVTKAKGFGLGPASMRSEGLKKAPIGIIATIIAAARGTAPRKERCCRIGRGKALADWLKLLAERRAPASGCAVSSSRRGSSV